MLRQCYILGHIVRTNVIENLPTRDERRFALCALCRAVTPHPPVGRSGLFALNVHNPSAGEGPARAGW